MEEFVIRVFISSTFSDLAEYRNAASQAIEMLDLFPERMELFLAQPDSPLDVCLREIEGCDLFVGIYARRYGTIPDGYSKSMTEMEFDYAQSKSLPVFAFFLDSNCKWEKENTDDGEAGRKLAEFKRRIDSNYTRTTFTTPDNLSLQIVASLAKYLMKLSIKIREERTEEAGKVELTEEAGKVELTDTRESLPNQQRIHVEKVFNRIADIHGVKEMRGGLPDRDRKEKQFLLEDYYSKTSRAILSACQFALDSGTLNLSTPRLNTIAIRLFGLLISSAIGRFGQQEGQVSISMSLDFARYNEITKLEESKMDTFVRYASRFQNECISDADLEAYNLSSTMSFDDFNQWWTTNRRTPINIGWKRLAHIASLEAAMWKRFAELQPKVSDLMGRIFLLLNGLTSERITDLTE